LNNRNQLRRPAVLNLDYSHLACRRNPARQRFNQNQAETQDRNETEFFSGVNHSLYFPVACKLRNFSMPITEDQIPESSKIGRMSDFIFSGRTG
jgi:hypothetical protein